MNFRSSQRGATLIFALILLVVLLVGGLSLIRTADTGMVIAGNLAFKRSATHSADRGLEEARNWLRAASAGTLEVDNPAEGYYATHQAAITDFTGITTPGSNADDFDWESNGKKLDTPDVAGNRVAYVIHRLCNGPGAPSPSGCESHAAASSSISTSGGLVYGRGALQGQRAYLYRITVRSTGPRNTRSIVQSVIIL